jgi:hypothetical protein
MDWRHNCCGAAAQSFLPPKTGLGRSLDEKERIMLGQLSMYWIAYSTSHPGRWSAGRLDLEIGQWMSQHCLDADDFAFSLAIAMRDALKAA